MILLIFSTLRSVAMSDVPCIERPPPASQRRTPSGAPDAQLIADPGVSAQTHRFEVSPDIIGHLIERQAGSLEKAVLEMLMNGIDARAREISVSFDSPRELTITDDGHGFETRDSILKHFRVFGFTHDTPEERDRRRVLGKFGLGRGQIFSFGATVWETNRFEMRVDIRKRDLAFELLEHPEVRVHGCRIRVSLYEPVSRLARAATVEEIRRQIKYAPVRVAVDGRRANVDPAKLSWTEETDKFRFRVGSAAHKGVDVYNVGVYVCNYPHYRFGVSGVLVSKLGHTFELNTARNDVLMSRCPLWRDAVELFGRLSETEVRKGRLRDDDRMAILRKIVWGEAPAEHHLDTPLFKTVHTASRTDRLNPPLSLLACVSSTIQRTSCAPCAPLPRRRRRLCRALVRHHVLSQPVDEGSVRSSGMRIDTAKADRWICSEAQALSPSDHSLQAFAGAPNYCARKARPTTFRRRPQGGQDGASYGEAGREVGLCAARGPYSGSQALVGRFRW